MKRDQVMAFLRREGWLLAALAVCAALCLLSGLAGGNATLPEEQRISRVLSAMEGAGAVEVAVYYAEAVPCGALVVADGASSMTVRLRLTEAVSALLGLAEDRIAVYPREGDS